MVLERLTKNNFVLHPPFFTVYDYWYNTMVDYINNLSTTVGSLETGITAFATGGQASATALTDFYNNITVCATAGDSVKLPTAVATTTLVIKNNGAASLNVFPNTDDCINGLAANLAVGVPVGAEIKLTAIDGVTWETDSETLVLSSPSTQKGQLIMRAANNAAETVTLITNVSQADTRTYSIPDAGGNAYFVLDPSLDGKTLNLHENLVIGEGYDVTITAEDVAGSIVLDEQTFEVEGEGTATRLTKIVNLADAAATLSISGVTCALDQDLRIAAGPTFASLKSAAIGTLGAATVTAVHYGDGRDFTSVFTLANFIIGPLAGAAAAKVLVPATTMWSFPAGAHLLVVSYASLGVTATGTAVTPDIGLGSVAGDGSANATLNLSAAGAEDIMTGYAIADTVTHAAVAAGPIGATAGILTGISLNGASGVKAVYLNGAATWNADNTGNLTASGTVVIKWTKLA